MCSKLIKEPLVFFSRNHFAIRRHYDILQISRICWWICRKRKMSKHWTKFLTSKAQTMQPTNCISTFGPTRIDSSPVLYVDFCLHYDIFITCLCLELSPAQTSISIHYPKVIDTSPDLVTLGIINKVDGTLKPEWSDSSFSAPEGGRASIQYSAPTAKLAQSRAEPPTGVPVSHCYEAHSTPVHRVHRRPW